MKGLLLTAAAVSLLGGVAWGNSYQTVGGAGTLSSASPNGKYIVGYNPNYNLWNVFQESYIYNVETGKLEWVTEYSEEDLSAGGEFADVSNDGVVCGVSKDMDNVVTWEDFMDTFTGPTQVATIWENGERKALPYGDIDPTKFEYIEDGTFAKFISGDGNVVAGYAGYGNGALNEPRLWTRDNGGEWSVSKLQIPDGAGSVTLYGMSADGKTILGGGYINDQTRAIIWKNGECSVVEGPVNPDPNNFVNVQVLSLSPDGRYVVMSHNFKGLIYDTETGEYRFIPTFEDTDMLGMTAVVDNKGNVYSVYNGYPVSHPFIYIYGKDRTLDLNYYIGIVDPELSETVAFSNMCSFTNITEDGTQIFGNTSMYGGSPWIMQLNAEDVTVPEAPAFTYASSRNLHEVTLRWTRGDLDCGGYQLVGYNVLRNGERIAEVAADKEELEQTLASQPVGYPSYALEAVYSKDGKELKSPASNSVSVAVAPDYSLPLFEGFEISLQMNYWTQTRDYGDPTQAVWSCFGGAGVQNGMGAYSSVSGGKPYSFSLESRPMDATGEEYVSVSFGSNHAMLNDNNQILDTDYISIEVSTDMGDNWTTVRSWKLSELATGNWSFKNVDISDAVAGKVFKVRVRRHGEGNGMYIAGLDNLAVNTSMDLATPQNLTGVRNNDGSATLLWKSLSGTYNLNKLGYMRTMNLSFGNDGGEMIAGNKYTPSQLATLKGKYITSISAPFNFDTWYDEVYGVNATAVIFEDGVLVREQDFGDITYNDYNVVALDEPYLISGDKEIIVGVKIYDYDAEQWPLIAATADDFVKGETDIYSEDGGKTWQYASEFFPSEDIRSYIIWDVTAHVTDSPESCEINYGELPLYYNVYRDGEIANTVALDGNASAFTDVNANDDSSYQVVAHGFDGSMSDFSNVFSLIQSGIGGIVESSEGMAYAAGDGEVAFDGECMAMTVVAADGRVVRTVAGNKVSVKGLPAGIYFVNASATDGVRTMKIVVR